MAISLDTTTAFPADWNSIAEPGPPFRHDRMHFPFPISPLMASAFPAFSEGQRDGVRGLGIPERAFEIRVVNHYRYDRILVDIPASEAEAAAQAALTERSIQRELGRKIDRWFGEHRPRLVELDRRLRQMRPSAADGPAVLAMLDEADAIHREAWRIHFSIVPVMGLSMQLLREMYADLFGDDDGAMTLMAGNVSESLKAGFALADLAQRARELGLAETLLSTPVDALPAALEASSAGMAFLADLRAFLEVYGLRQDLFDFATPTWRENPSVALASVRSYLETGHDPRATHAQVAQAAEAAFETARRALASYPGSVWSQFEHLVQIGREGAFLQEEHNFYIDQRLLSLLRLFYLDVGAHLRHHDVLDRADDVFMLSLGEIRELVAVPDPVSARALAVARRDELRAAAAMAPPPMIGDPAGAPPVPDTPMARSLAAFFGAGPSGAPETGRVRGAAASRGVVSGVARVARTLDEASAIQPGEILVTVTTMPAWTPLFGIAAAVVTETGGPLSHCAVVAREYGIPAVVGAHGATRAIRTGQRVTVDGSAGLVTIEP